MNIKRKETLKSAEKPDRVIGIFIPGKGSVCFLSPQEDSVWMTAGWIGIEYKEALS